MYVYMNQLPFPPQKCVKPHLERRGDGGADEGDRVDDDRLHEAAGAQALGPGEAVEAAELDAAEGQGLCVVCWRLRRGWGRGAC